MMNDKLAIVNWGIVGIENFNEFERYNKEYTRKVMDMIVERIVKMHENKDACCWYCGIFMVLLDLFFYR